MAFKILNRTSLKHNFFSESSECYVPDTVLNSLDRDEKTVEEEPNDCTVLLQKMSPRCSFPFYIFLINLFGPGKKE